jgi:hypothetical protein
MVQMPCLGHSAKSKHRNQIEILTLQQDQRFDRLEDNIQKMIEGFLLPPRRYHNLQPRFVEHTYTTSNTKAAQLALREQEQEEEARLLEERARFQEEKERKIHAAYPIMLKSLHFPTMHHRFDAIALAHKKTFDWVFREKVGKSPKSFINWLGHESGVYWIQGKAASGKSTLMRFISEDARTKRNLETWSKIMASEVALEEQAKTAAGAAQQKQAQLEAEAKLREQTQLMAAFKALAITDTEMSIEDISMHDKALSADPDGPSTQEPLIEMDPSLEVARFYFWSGGLLEQQSQQGLLRSLLYEILSRSSHRKLIPQIFPKEWKDLLEYGIDHQNWSLSSLHLLSLNWQNVRNEALKCVFSLMGLTNTMATMHRWQPSSLPYPLNTGTLNSIYLHVLGLCFTMCLTMLRAYGCKTLHVTISSATSAII